MWGRGEILAAYFIPVLSVLHSSQRLLPQAVFACWLLLSPHLPLLPQ
jgi:hypothetical protein